MAYEQPALPPGLAGYQAAIQGNQQQSMGQLQQMQAVMGLQGAMQQQQQAAQMRQAMAGAGGDPEKALAIALQSGNIEAAKQLAPIVKLKQEQQQQAVLESGNMNDPAFLRRAGMALKRPEFITHAERIDKERQNAEMLKSFQSSPGVQPDPQELQQAADQGTPAPASKPKGGLFASLTQSEIPAIAQQAKELQGRLDTAGAHIPAEHWANWQKALAGQETSLLERRNAKDDKAGSPLTEIAKANEDLKAGRITKEQHAAIVGKSTGAGPLNLGPEAIDQAAARYKIDGSLPTNLGRGAQGAMNTSKILNRAAEMAREDGDSPEAARLRQLSGNADKVALNQLVKQKNMVLAFEKNAVANADLALEQSSKVDRLGSPVIDRWIQAGKKNVGGDVEVAKLDTAIRTFVNEYARVTTSVSGGGVTSDTARKEIDELLKGAMTHEQVVGVIDLMKKEMGNRKVGYEQQEQEIRNRLLGKPEVPKAATPGAPKRLKFDAQGNPV